MADCFVVEGVTNGIKPHSSDELCRLARALPLSMKIAYSWNPTIINSGNSRLYERNELSNLPRAHDLLSGVAQSEVVVHKHVVEVRLVSIHGGFEQNVPSRGPSGAVVQEILHVRHI